MHTLKQCFSNKKQVVFGEQKFLFAPDCSPPNVFSFQLLQHSKVLLTYFPNISRGGTTFSPSVLPTLKPCTNMFHLQGKSFLLYLGILRVPSLLTCSFPTNVKEKKSLPEDRLITYSVPVHTFPFQREGWGRTSYTTTEETFIKYIFWINQSSPPFIHINQAL